MRRPTNRETVQTNYKIPADLVESLSPFTLGLEWDDSNGTWAHHHSKYKRSDIPDLKQYLWDIRKQVYLAQDPNAIATSRGTAKYISDKNVTALSNDRPQYKTFYYFEEITDDLAKAILGYGIKIKQDAERKWFLPEYDNIPNVNFAKNLQILTDRFGMPTIGEYFWADFVGAIGRPSAGKKKNSTLITVKLRDDKDNFHSGSFIAHYIEGPSTNPERPWDVPIILSNAEKVLRMEDGTRYSIKEVAEKFPGFIFPTGQELDVAILNVRKSMHEKGMFLYQNDPAGYTRFKVVSYEGNYTLCEHFPVPKESIYHVVQNFVSERENIRAWERCRDLAEQMAETYPHIGITFKRDHIDQFAFYTNIPDKKYNEKKLCFGQYQFCDLHELAEAAERNLETWILKSLHSTIEAELAPYEWKAASFETKKSIHPNALYERIYDAGDYGTPYQAVIAREKNSFIPIFDGTPLDPCPMRKSIAENTLDQHYTRLLAETNDSEVRQSRRSTPGR